MRINYRKPSLGFTIAGLLLATAAHADKLEVEVTEVPYRETVAFLQLYIEGLGPARVERATGESDGVSQLGAGLRAQSARDRDLQLDLIIGYRRVDVRELDMGPDRFGFFDMAVGGHWYPRTPTFAVGNTTIRLMAGAAAGITVGGTVDFIVDATAGLSMSRGDGPSGVTFEVVYRPLAHTVEYYPEPDSADALEATVGSRWMLRVGVLFSP